jgi:hypothetical protein
MATGTAMSQSASTTRKQNANVWSMLEQLAQMPIERLHLPYPANARLRKIANGLINDPSSRNTIDQWRQRSR